MVMKASDVRLANQLLNVKPYTTGKLDEITKWHEGSNHYLTLDGTRTDKTCPRVGVNLDPHEVERVAKVLASIMRRRCVKAAQRLHELGVEDDTTT